MSHLWPLDPARASPQPLARSPASSHHCLSPRGCNSPSVQPWAREAVVMVLMRGSWGITSTHAPLCSSDGHSQAGVKHAEGAVYGLEQATRCRRMSPIHTCSGIAT